MIYVPIGEQATLLPGHDITRELRPATCCDRHTNIWVVCSCGYEANEDNHPAGTWGAATDHRLDLLEAAFASPAGEGDK